LAIFGSGGFPMMQLPPSVIGCRAGARPEHLCADLADIRLCKRPDRGKECHAGEGSTASRNWFATAVSTSSPGCLIPMLQRAPGRRFFLTELMIFGKPRSGTPIMVCNQRAGIDLPLRAPSWQDQSRQVWLAMAWTCSVDRSLQRTKGNADLPGNRSRSDGRTLASSDLLG
jgi:hypothetical protein